MRGIAGRRFVAIIVLALLAACVFLAGRLAAAKGLTWATDVATIASLVLVAAIAVVPFLGKLLEWLHGDPPVSGITLQQARAGFADALAKQWAEEDKARRVYDPRPLPVRWRLVGGAAAQAGPRPAPKRPATKATDPFTGIKDTFKQSPDQRMVILGAAGAGKSVLAIKLVRDLLADRPPGDPVPVLLPAATWTRDCSMTEWIIEQLVRSQPSLDVRIRTEAGEKVSLPRALAESGVIPVIDGLDELPPDRRTAVIAEINAYGSDSPLVLTSRPGEYYAAVTARDVSRAVVIELERLRVSEVKKYLTEGTAAPHDRWERVFGRLDAEPDGVLATTLSTPLMIWLTRTVYENAESDPDELLDPVRLADRDAIESHLVAAYVPAVYPGRQRRSRPRSFQCTSARATRWFGFLAYRLNRTRTQEIAWWRLSLAEPGGVTISMAVRAALYACVIWLAATWALTRRGYWRHGTYVGHGHYQDLLLAGPLGHAIRPLTNAGLRGLASTPASMRQQTADVDQVARAAAHLGLFRFTWIMAACGVLVSVIVVSSRSTATPQTLRITWRSLARKVFGPLPWLATLAFLIWYANRHHQAVPAVLGTPAGRWVLLWLGLVLAARAIQSLRTPTEVAVKADPVDLLRADRRAYLLTPALLMTGFGITWLLSGSVIAVADTGGTAICLLIAVLLGGSSGAWLSYLDARLRLAVRGRLPWRTIAFLNDAHRRGVLRQTGAVYQFRHIRLQEQLADSYSPWPHRLVPVAGWAERRLAVIAPGNRLLGTGTDPADATEYAASTEVRLTSPLQFLGAPLLAAIAAVLLLNVLSALTGWNPLLLVVDLPVIVLIVKAVNRYYAGAVLGPGARSIRVTPGAIELTAASDVIRLTPDDVRLIAVRPIERCWSCYAVHALLRPGLTAPTGAAGTWLPLFWAPGYTTRVSPALVSALAGFSGHRLESRLATWLGRQGLAEFQADGTVEVVSIPATLGRRLLVGVPALLVLAGLLALIGWRGPALLAGLAAGVLVVVCFRRLSMRSARGKLPAGPWSLHVQADALEITQAGPSLRLTAEDIESIEFHPVRRKSRTAVQARLRSQTAADVGAPDGWIPLYWQPDLSTGIPAELAVSLAVFASGRLRGSLRRKAARARKPKAPVLRRSRAHGLVR
jgi:hypothetical protein